jgi:uncharacterized protein (TIGR02453 family)
MNITKETMQFLKDLRTNNNREWFTKNKDRYISANENFIQFVQVVIDTVRSFDSSVKGLDARNCVYRIYRDIRFSKDKSPYKTYLEATLMGKDKSCGIAGYHLHLEPGNTILAGGVHMSDAKQIRAIREEISGNWRAFLKIIQDEEFIHNFTIVGEKLKNVPQGFEKEDPLADFLKYKELMLHHPVDHNDITSVDFVSYCAGIYRSMVPFNKFVNRPVLALK